MAKGQKRGNREARKPKQDKRKKAAESITLPDRSVGNNPIPVGKKRAR